MQTLTLMLALSQYHLNQITRSHRSQPEIRLRLRLVQEQTGKDQSVHSKTNKCILIKNKLKSNVFVLET